MKQRFPLALFGVLMLVDVSSWALEKEVTRRVAGEGLSFYWALLEQPLMWIVILGLPLQLFLWSKVLSHADLALAYAASSISYPLTMLTALIIFHEQQSLLLWFGAFLITSGVAVLGYSKRDEAHE